MRGRVDQQTLDIFNSLPPEGQRRFLEGLSQDEVDAFRGASRETRATEETTPTTEPQRQSGGGDSLGTLGGIIVGQNLGGGGSASLGAPEVLSVARGPAGTFPAQTGLEAANATTAGQAAGYGVAAYNSLDALNNIVSGSRRGKGAVEGVGTIGGTVGGYLLGGPLGAGVGSMAGRTLGRGLASAAESFGAFQPSGDEIMQSRIDDLAEKGVNVPDAEQRVADYGLTREELIAREQAKVDAGGIGNPTFAASRNEADLTPEDTWGGLMWFETLGNDYLETTAENQRREMNQRALDEGLIDEARGQLTTNNPERLTEIYNEVLEDTPPVDPSAIKDGEPDQFRAQESRQPQSSRPRRPRPMNDMEEIIEETTAPPPLIEPPPPPPPLKTPKDYAAAYVNVYNQNQGLPINPQLTGRY